MEGLVEVKVGGKWGPLCGGNSFGFGEATVVCRQLGYSEYDNYYNDGGNRFDIDTSKYDEAFYIGLFCGGHENSISECDYRLLRGTTALCATTSNYKFLYAGVKCQNSIIHTEGKREVESARFFSRHETPIEYARFGENYGIRK